MKRDRGSEKGPPTYTHIAHTHTHPTRSEVSPATWRPWILKKFFFGRQVAGGDLICRDCMSVCMVYRLESPKKIKIKIKRRGKKAGRKTGKSPMTRRATHLLNPENIRTAREHQSTVKNIREHHRRTVKRTS